MYVYILYQDQRVTDLVRITALDYEGRKKDVQVADKGGLHEGPSASVVEPSKLSMDQGE